LSHGFIVRFLYQNKLSKQVLSAIVFGGICVVGMIAPIELSPAVIFDPQAVILSMVSLFGGTIVALIASVIARSYRIWLGGVGMLAGVVRIIISSCLGLVYRYGVQKGWAQVKVIQRLAFGFVLQLVQVLLIIQLPDAIAETAIVVIALLLILIFTAATAFLGILLKDAEDRFKTEHALRPSESPLPDHLHNTPLAALSWDENFKVSYWNKAAEKNA
jgi:LytS/YehU family sensor histidine kinase